jgi:RNase P subunit RPR2
VRENQRALALERMERLVRLAEEAWPRDRPLSKRYLELAWRLKLRYRVRLPPHLR